MQVSRVSGGTVQIGMLSGTRFLAAFWIVCQHFVPHSKSGMLVKALWRSNSAVNYLILLSGFVTHWASRKRLLDTFGKVKAFYIRRFGRVVMTTWFTMLLAVVLLKIGAVYLGFGHVVRCFFFVETWIQPNHWCPNGQTWTVAALVPSWLLYPVLTGPCFYRSKRIYCIGLLLLALPFMETIYLYWQNHSFILTSRDHDRLYLWPPSQLADFGLGVLAAEVAARRLEANCGPSQSIKYGRLADLCVSIVALIIFFVPNPNLRYRTGLEPLIYDHGLSPLFALFLAFSALDTRSQSSFFGQLCSHPALSALGNCSFEVYLFQWPLHTIFDYSGLPTHQGQNFIAFILTLWLLSSLYELYIERPFVSWLRRLAPPPVDTNDILLSRSEPQQKHTLLYTSPASTPQPTSTRELDEEAKA